jgi:hypothetical protein
MLRSADLSEREDVLTCMHRPTFIGHYRIRALAVENSPAYLLSMLDER